MIRVNLLPHRQIKRAERQRQFGLMAAFTSIAAAAVVFSGWTYLSTQIASQTERNGRLETAIGALDKQISDIKTLKDEIGMVLERKQIVENLQTNRNQTVVLLDEIARQLPEGLYLTSIKQTGNSIALQGVADTNARVATLVRNLSNSNWFEAPNLTEIKANTVNGVRQNDFAMTVVLRAQKPPEDANNANAKKGA